MNPKITFFGRMLRMIRPGPNDEMSLRNPVQAFPEQARLSKHEGCRERVALSRAFHGGRLPGSPCSCRFLYALPGKVKIF